MGERHIYFGTILIFIDMDISPLIRQRSFKITEIEDLPTTVTHFFISLPNILVDELRYKVEVAQAHLGG